MKCIKPTPESIETAGANPREVIRVKDDKAQRAVSSGHYTWASRSEWKNAGRHYSGHRISREEEVTEEV